MLTILKEFFSSAKITEALPVDALSTIELGEDLFTKLKQIGCDSFFIREVDAGSSNDCEHEIAALENPIYDFSRFGFKIVASPRHADILLVSGPVSANMKEALLKAYEASPDPKIVIAVGDGAISGRISSKFSGKALLKVSDCIPVDLEIPGNPPNPKEILLVLLSLQKAARGDRSR